MKRLYYANASETPPKPPKNPSYGYPQDGDRAAGKLPTTLGAWWHHMITEEFMNVIEGAGLEPDENNLHQLADIFEDFRSRATASEQYKLAAEAAASRAETAASGVVTETAEKIQEIQQAGDNQISAIEAKESDVQADITAALQKMETALSEYIERLQAEGSSQSVVIVQQAQALLSEIQDYASQAQAAANEAAAKTREEIIDSVVLTTEQELSTEKQSQARLNIGFKAGIEAVLVPILKELCLEYGATQAEIDALENS